MTGQEYEVKSPSRLRSLPPKQGQLLNWFRMNAAPLAEAYDGAIQLLENRNFPGRVHFIAHAVRDIADRLVYVLDPQLPSRRVQYEPELDHIEKLWPNLQTFTGPSDGSLPHDSVTIDYRLVTTINSLVTAHRERRKQPSNYELLFRVLMRHEPTRAGVNQRLVSDFKKMRDWFMALTHLRKQAPVVSEDELRTQFGRFEGMLYSFVGDFFAGVVELDGILQQANQ